MEMCNQAIRDFDPHREAFDVGRLFENSPQPSLKQRPTQSPASLLESSAPPEPVFPRMGPGLVQGGRNRSGLAYHRAVESLGRH